MSGVPCKRHVLLDFFDKRLHDDPVDHLPMDIVDQADLHSAGERLEEYAKRRKLERAAPLQRVKQRQPWAGPLRICAPPPTIAVPPERNHYNDDRAQVR